MDINDRPDDITLLSLDCFSVRFIFMLPRCFLKRSFLWLFSPVSFHEFFGLLSTYWPSSVSRSCLVPSLAMCEMRTRRFVRFFYNASCWTDFSNRAFRRMNLVKAVQIIFLVTCGVNLFGCFCMNASFAAWDWSRDAL